MKEIQLKYGLNPNQKDAFLSTLCDDDLPIEVVNGRAGYINLLDAFGGWALVSELREATGLPAAASFKHTSPAGAAVGKPLNDTLKAIYWTGGIDLSPLGAAYARARGADRMSSFGDFIALSDECDLSIALLIKKEVSDGVIAPGYTSEALEILKSKKGGSYCIIKIDKDYKPSQKEERVVFGMRFIQDRNNIAINADILGDIVTKNKTMTKDDKDNLVIALITLKYTQSNSVCFALDGQAIGIGAGQQSRVHCTRLAASKARTWFLRQHPKVLSLPFRNDLKRADRDNAIDVYVNNYFDIISGDLWREHFMVRPDVLSEEEKAQWIESQKGVALASDAFFPFSDNIECAHSVGVSVISEPGGSVRDDEVIKCCDKYNIAMAFSKIRLFTH